MSSHYPKLPFDFAAAKAQRDATTHVYFVEGAGLIKIGFAVSPLARFAAMLTVSPVPLSLLASMPGGQTMENALHKRFAASRSHGEWFRNAPELDAVISAAPHQYGQNYRDRLASFTRQVLELEPKPKPKKAPPSLRKVLRALRPDQSYPARYDGL